MKFVRRKLEQVRNKLKKFRIRIVWDAPLDSRTAAEAWKAFHQLARAAEKLEVEMADSEGVVLQASASIMPEVFEEWLKKEYIPLVKKLKHVKVIVEDEDGELISV